MNHTTKTPWPKDVVDAAVAAYVSGRPVKEIAGTLQRSREYTHILLKRWMDAAGQASSRQSRRTRHAVVPLDRRLAWLHDVEHGQALPDRLRIQAFLADPGVKVHRAYHRHLKMKMTDLSNPDAVAVHNLPHELAVAFGHLPVAAKQQGDVGCGLGILPSVQLGWRPGRARIIHSTETPV